jgi:hypothetical protein
MDVGHKCLQGYPRGGGVTVNFILRPLKSWKEFRKWYWGIKMCIYFIFCNYNLTEAENYITMG